MTQGDWSRFVSGMSVGGRYRLLAPHGGRPQLQFWYAIDLASGQEVGLTLVDPARELPAEFVHEILARTVRLKGMLSTAGLARVLDVLHTGEFGVVVSEWISGGSLRQVADTHPSPAGVAGAMQSLAAAAEEAHRAGLLLSIDHPTRLRVSSDGRAVLAFPAVMPEATARSDLRGIGCALYALLLNQWPDSEGASADWPPAALDSSGQPAEPATVNPEIGFLISTTTMALLREQGGIASAATLLTLLRQIGADAAENSNCRVMAPLPPPPPGLYATFRNFGPAERRDAARGHIIRAGLAAAAVIVLVSLLSLGSTLNGFLGVKDQSVAMDTDKLGLSPQPSTPNQPPPTQGRPEASAPGDRLTPTTAAVFSPDGSPDSPREAGLAIDGKTDTAWSTDRYFDADPFPKFKSGVGLVVELPRAAQLSAVTVDLSSSGTVVQVRSSRELDPHSLGDTTELSPPIPVHPGANRIPITDSAPVSHVMVWISTLGSTGNENRAALSEIGVQTATPA
jgi:putative peptidoglycan lipid II flippase